MSVVKYLQNCESGFFNNVSSGNSRGENFNFDFLLPRLKSKADDVFVVCDEGQEEVPPTAARFCKKHGREHILAVASESGGVALLNTKARAQKSLLAKWNAHSNAIFDICWTDSNLLTASGDKMIQLWDTTVQEHICTMKGHTSSVKALDMQPYSSSVFASGSRDGNIMVWDVRIQSSANNLHPVIVIHNAHDAHSIFGNTKHRRRVPEQPCCVRPLNAITNVVYQSEHWLLSSGASDSEVNMWDLRTSGKESTLRKRISHYGESAKPKGYSSMALHPNRSTFFANGVDSIIYQYSCSTSDLVATYYGHKVNSYFVKLALSGDGKYVVAGSSDEKAYIWKVDKPGAPIVALAGHSDEVTSVAWCPLDPTKVVTCSDDSRVRCWNLHPETNRGPRRDEHLAAAEAEEIDREATKPPPSLASVTCGKPKTVKTPKLGNSNYSPVLTRWLTPQRTACVATPINVTPVKRTFTLPKKRNLSDEDAENSPRSSKRTPCSPNSKNVLTQRHLNGNTCTVARRLNSSFTAEEPHANVGESSEKSQPTSSRFKKKKTNTLLNKRKQPVLNSIKKYFHVLSRT